MFAGYEATCYVQDHEELAPEEEGVPPRLVPHKYNLTRKCNPWALCEDLIMVGECSELEGPKPLHIISDRTRPDFDTNHFAVKIMAVDTQAVKSAHFSLNEDMNILLIEDTCATYAYVHHFTLYDTEARGFVRPFCMAYVSSDREKMCDQYEAMSKEFYKVSKEIFQMYNIKVFKLDLENRIEDLKYTRSCFLENLQREESDPDLKDLFKGVTLSTIENLLHEAMTVYNVVLSKYDSYKRHGSKVSGGDNTSIGSQTSKREPYILDVRNWRRFDFSLRSLEKLCQGGADEGLFTLESIYKHFNRSSLALHMELVERKFSTPSHSMVTFGKIMTGNLFYYKESICNHGYSGASPQNSQSSSFSSGTAESFKSASDQYCAPSDQLANSVAKKSLSTGSFQLIASIEENRPGDSDAFDASASQLFSVYSGCVDCAKNNTKRHTEQSSVKTSVMHVDELTWTSPGYNLLYYVNHLPYLVDVIYSLLRGSSVVVMATHKQDSEVAPLLKALSLFVPTCYSTHHHIIVDVERLPQVLSKSKLVGCIRSPKEKKDLFAKMEGVITVDLDKKACNAPSYKAGLLQSCIMSKRKFFKHEQTFLSHIHCVLLEFVMKAFVSVHFKRKITLKNNMRNLALGELSQSDDFIVQGLINSVLPTDT